MNKLQTINLFAHVDPITAGGNLIIILALFGALGLAFLGRLAYNDNCFIAAKAKFISAGIILVVGDIVFLITPSIINYLNNL